MSTNKHKPHLLVLPEDDKNREIANGFHLKINSPRQYQVMTIANGWSKVLEIFKETYEKTMLQNMHRFMVLLIDFDNSDNRYSRIMEQIPQQLHDRVFILGVKDEPDKLQSLLGHKRTEDIGKSLAEECLQERTDLWEHPQLAHNIAEIKRMPPDIRRILF